MDKNERLRLQVLAQKGRMLAVEAIGTAHSGHPGGSLSCMDILTYLYNKEMQIDPRDPKNPDRDRFVLSKGHAAPALYSVLALRGYFDPALLKTLRQPDSILQGHPDMKAIPGVDMSTGSLGQGVSAACGMALAARLQGRSYRVYTLLGDGEIEEGQVWEAMMFAAHHKLTNLCVMVDYNGLQIDGPITEVMSSLPIGEKLKAFNLNVLEIDGNDMEAIEEALRAARACTDRPTTIVLHTVKGKGVSYMENVCSWHGNPPNAEQMEEALKELRATCEEWEAQIDG